MRERISRLGLGTAQFGLDYGVSNPAGRVPRAEVAVIIERAISTGISTYDTAPAYGSAEALLGATLPSDASTRIVTKTMSFTEGLDAVVACARRSAELLARAPVDVLLVHNASDLLRPDGPKLWHSLQRLRGEGLFNRIGVSAYVEDEPLDLARRFDVEVMQLPLSLIDQRLIADGTLAKLKDQGIEIHARSLFLQGLIFLDPTRLPSALTHAAPRISEIHAKLREARTDPLTAALAFVLDRPEVDTAVIGVTSVAELVQIIDTAIHPLPDLDWPKLSLDDPIVLNPSRW